MNFIDRLFVEPHIPNIKFRINPSNVVTLHSNAVSKEVHTRKKYYYEARITGISNTGYFVTDKHIHKMDVSDMALYIAPEYMGTNPKGLSEMLSDHREDYLSGKNYPLCYVYNNMAVFTLSDIRRCVTDIHTEIDNKDGKQRTKYIFHCYDDEDRYDMYLVMYDTSLILEARSYLLNPDWIR